MSAATLIFTLHKTNFTFLPLSPQWTLSKSSPLVIKCLTCHLLVAKFSIKGCKKTTCQQHRGLCQPFLLCFLTSVLLKKIKKNLCHCSLLIFVVVGLGTSFVCMADFHLCPTKARLTQKSILLK